MVAWSCELNGVTQDGEIVAAVWWRPTKLLTSSRVLVTLDTEQEKEA